jgi:hypothetical protein
MNAPTNLTVVDPGVFNWEDNSADEDGYSFENYSKKDKEWQSVGLFLANTTSLDYSNHGPTGGPQKYRVRAFQGVIGTPLTFSDPSNEVSYSF